MKLRHIFKFRVVLLLIVLIIGLWAINPNFDTKGAAVRAVEIGSSASEAGIASPDLSKVSPTNLEIIKIVNQKEVSSPEDYGSIIEKVKVGEVINIETDKGNYAFLKEENRSVGVSVAEVASSNLRKGLDLQGGTRVLLRPVSPISDSERRDVIDIMNNRLNTYGLSDITIREADDLTGGEKFILVEIAGATREEVKNLIESQGKFEAKIGDEVVFRGSEKDIVYVCKNDGSCSGVSDCQDFGDGAYCEFVFSIQLSEAAARRHADMTDKLSINSTGSDGGRYLNQTLDLYLDDSLVSSLQIGSSLKGVYTDKIQISGPGVGPNTEAALDDAIKEMERLQTVLITGSLPVKLETVKIDNISPTLGRSFVQNALLAGALAFASVAFVLLIRYRTLKIVIPSAIAMFSELFLILATAALFKFSLDLAAIAGIIAAIGTGVDDQIVISDEILRGGTAISAADWKRRIKRAFFVVFVAYAATVAAMIPLFVAGAGLLTGFAFSTIVGVTVGVFITRPAFASLAETLLRKNE